MVFDSITVIGSDKEVERVDKLFTKYGYDVANLKIKSRENLIGFFLVGQNKDEYEKIAARKCPVIISSNNPILKIKIKKKLLKLGLQRELIVDDSIISSSYAEELIDTLSFNDNTKPNEYMNYLLSSYPQCTKDILGTLSICQVEKIRKSTDSDKKTLAIYYPSTAYRNNLGSIEMYEKIQKQGYNVIFLFGVLCNDEFEKRPNSFYAGHDIVKLLDFVDVFIIPTLTDGLPERSKKLLFVHDIYDSPSGKAEAPDKSKQTVSPLIDELDYTFLPCKSLMPKSNVVPYKRKKPLCRIPGGYIKLDRNLEYYERKKFSTDSIIYAPTVCGDEFEKYVSLPKHGEKIVGALLEKFPDYKIIFRPHPHTVDTDYTKKIVKRFADEINFVFDSNPSFYMDNYCRSAVMVSDMSGTAFTFAFTTLRPVVFFSHNEETVEEAFGNVRYFMDRAKIGHVATNIEELEEKVSLCLDNSLKYIEDVRAFRGSEMYNLGRVEDYFVENFHHIVENTRNSDWSYVVSADQPSICASTMEVGGMETKVPPGGEKSLQDILVPASSDAPEKESLVSKIFGIFKEMRSGKESAIQPVLIESGYKGFNILDYDGKYYAILQKEGAFSIKKFDRNKYKYSLVGDSPEETKGLIDALGVDEYSDDPILVEGGFLGFNILTFKGKYYGLGKNEGAFEIEKFESNEYKMSVVGDSIEEVKRLATKLAEESTVITTDPILEEKYRNYNIISYGLKYYGLPHGSGEFDIEKVDNNECEGCVVDVSIEKVKSTIDLLRREKLTTNLVEAGYLGFNIISYDEKYYAIAQDEGKFDISKIESGDFKKYIVADSIRLVKRSIKDTVRNKIW